MKKIIGYDANALYLWAIAQQMPTGKHEHIKTYDLKQLIKDILNDKLFGFIQVETKLQWTKPSVGGPSSSPHREGAGPPLPSGGGV